jgi:hypothetical protein
VQGTQPVIGVPTQRPFWQASFCVHTLLSEHALPFCAAECAHAPVCGLQLSVVHGLPSLQLTGAPAAQRPAWQVSAPLQALPSEHEVPSASGACAHVPVAGLQLSAVHTLPSSQLSGVPAAHTPFWQVSAPLQALPSEHEVPLPTAACTHAPVCGLQLSLVQGLPSLQFCGVPAVQAPFWQVSAPLHGLPSEHEVPFATALCVQAPVCGLQLSLVQGLPSLQFCGVPAVQAPFWQVSAPLHRLPSEHEVPLATALCWHPSIGSQLSLVQGLPSLQFCGVPAVQAPF